MTSDVHVRASEANSERETVVESVSPRAMAERSAGELYVAKDEM